MKRTIESYINAVTMYRLVVYGLGVIVGMSLILSLLGVIERPFMSLVLSLAVLIGVSYGTSRLFAWTFSTRHNRESWLITALILFFLLIPVQSTKGLLAAAFVAVIAVASKYILVYQKRHIFNPAAVAVVLSSLIGLAHAGWWVATPYLLPAVIVIGILITWKVRHFAMVAMYILTAVLTTLVVAVINGYSLQQELSILFLSSPIIFAATIMLTEPFTAPQTRKWQFVYAILVGFLTTCQLTPFLTPELAIVLGNILAFVVGQKGIIQLRFIETKTIAPRTIELIFKPVRKFTFTPGQYLELSLPHNHQDSRGMRRTFSLASSPDDEYVRFGITVSDSGSSFKKKLLDLKQGDIVRALRLGGDFVLPSNSQKEPLLFVAGGIGITPFHSMIDDLLRHGEVQDIILVHSVRNEESLVYHELIAQAEERSGLRYIPIVTEPSKIWGGASGFISFDILKNNIPDIAKRRIYLSGPSLMVEALEGQLIRGKIGRNRIVKDYFSGY